MSNVRPFLDKKRQALVAAESALPRKRAETIAYRARTADLVDDMESAGEEGLCWAGHGYSMIEGIPFRPFAQVVVDRSIFGFLRRELPHRKLRVAGYVISSWAAAQLSARSLDVLNPMHDDDERCVEKLHDYVEPKMLAGALALCLDAERSGDDPEQTALAAQVIALVRREMAQCDSIDQRLFSAIYGEGQSTEAAATELGIPEATARSRHFRLLRALRKAIDGRFPVSDITDGNER